MNIPKELTAASLRIKLPSRLHPAADISICFERLYDYLLMCIMLCIQVVIFFQGFMSVLLYSTESNLRAVNFSQIFMYVLLYDTESTSDTKVVKIELTCVCVRVCYFLLNISQECVKVLLYSAKSKPTRNEKTKIFNAVVTTTKLTQQPTRRWRL